MHNVVYIPLFYVQQYMGLLFTVLLNMQDIFVISCMCQKFYVKKPLKNLHKYFATLNCMLPNQLDPVIPFFFFNISSKHFFYFKYFHIFFFTKIYFYSYLKYIDGKFYNFISKNASSF